MDTVARVLADYYHLKTDTQLAALDEALSKVPAVSVGGGHGKDHVGDSNKMVGDSISRQAAIDALAEWHDEAITNRLNNLPSAQPDIVACGDCIHWICHDRRCGYWNHGVKPLDWCCHAELKLARILRGENPTPVPEVLAAEKVMEEAAEDVVPAAKGKWKRISPPDNDGNAIYRCSKCQHQDIHAIGCEVPYCWYCGARMDLKDGGNVMKLEKGGYYKT